MYCPKCGHEVGEHMVICPSCGELLENRNNDTVNSFSQPNYGWQQPEGMPKIQDIPDYKVQSILLIVFSAILCCVFCLPILALPFAIIALVNSNKIEAHIVAGNYEYARKVSENTKKWCWASFGILLGSIAISIVFAIVFMNSGLYKEFMNEFMKQYEYYYYNFQ